MEEIESVVKILEKQNDKESASNPAIKKTMGMVEDFIKTHRVMCYGGTAINNLLPVKDRFYDPVYDIPDYDFFSKTPQEHAMILANKLYDSGITNVEVKPGVHFGTFKVYADFTGVADITALDEDLFERLWKSSIKRNDIHYVPPDFLRMSMYLELSRPRGDVSRWAKVYQRLMLLNDAYPIQCKHPDPAGRVPITREIKKKIIRMLQKEPVILLGVTASEFHLRQKWTMPVILMAELKTIERLTQGKKVRVEEGTEILPTLHTVYEADGSSHMRFYEVNACHSYHTFDGIHIASIPTILQFFFAYLYTDSDSENIAYIQCIAQRLVEIAHTKPKRRFALLTPIECIGKQETLIEIRKEKAKLYEKVSKNKGSVDFLRYFFTYTPSMTKTQRQQIRNQLRKTRKSRTESLE
jgi:hypothetical protein